MKSAIKHLNKLLTLKPKKNYPQNLEPTMLITHLSCIKQVTKPWGFELWISDATSTPYALKIIYLKKGNKTSLQYHNQKAEHNFVFAGKIKLHYKNIKTNKIQIVTLKAGHLIEIKPVAIHRIEALTDTILIEASTAHLDDVIRLEDDYLRPDGKVESEHTKTAKL